MCGSILDRRRKTPATVVPFPSTEQRAAEAGAPDAVSEPVHERTPERTYDNQIQVTDAPQPGEFAPANVEVPPPRREPQRIEAPVAQRPREVVNAGGDSIFGDLTPVQDARDTSIGGPSILGLGGDSDGDYLLEDEDRHTGRKLLLTMFLLIVVGLLVLQWRGGGFNNIRAALSAVLQNPTAQTPTTTAPAQSASAQKPQSDQPAAASSEPAQSKPADAEAKSANAETKSADETAAAQPSAEKAAASEPKSADETVAAARKTPPAAEPKQKPEEATEQQAEEDAKPARKPPAVVVAPKPAEAPGARQYARAQAELSAHNCEQALIYFRAAADAGSAAAASKLGAMYATGNCATQDRAEAYRWISRAATQEPANTWLARNRDMLWSQMTQQERARAR
jgi:cytoskeletal protein RodZ